MTAKSIGDLFAEEIRLQDNEFKIFFIELNKVVLKSIKELKNDKK